MSKNKTLGIKHMATNFAPKIFHFMISTTQLTCISDAILSYFVGKLNHHAF